MYDEGYYWVLFDGYTCMEVFVYNGEHWVDFEGSICNTDFFKVIKKIQEPNDGEE